MRRAVPPARRGDGHEGREHRDHETTDEQGSPQTKKDLRIGAPPWHGSLRRADRGRSCTAADSTTARGGASRWGALPPLVGRSASSTTSTARRPAPSWSSSSVGADEPATSSSMASVGQTGASDTEPTFVPSAMTMVRRAACTTWRFTPASGRLMFVMPSVAVVPVHPMKAASTCSCASSTGAGGSTSECWRGRSVTPMTMTVKRGSRPRAPARWAGLGQQHGVLEITAHVPARWRWCDVDEDRLARQHEGGRHRAGRVLLPGMLAERLQVQVRDLTAWLRDDDGAPATDVALRVERFEVGADGDLGHAELARQVGDAHERLGAHQRDDRPAALLGGAGDTTWPSQRMPACRSVIDRRTPTPRGDGSPRTSIVRRTHPAWPRSGGPRGAPSSPSQRVRGLWNHNGTEGHRNPVSRCLDGRMDRRR